MGKIYDENGVKMNLAQILDEVVSISTDEQAKVLATNLAKYEFENDQMKLAHAILDSYKTIDSSTDQGARMRKLLDNLMNKYQKSTINLGADDKSLYHSAICDIRRKVGA